MGLTQPSPIAGHRRGLVLGGLLLGLLLAAIDQTVVGTALPTISGDLGGLAHLSWVVTANLLAATASAPLWGKAGDLYGRKGLLQLAVAVFTIGSMLAGLSQSLGQLIGFRAVQGLGASGLIVGAQAAIGEMLAPRERGRYQGLIAAAFGVTSILGPLVGGYVTANLSWRWVFFMSVPLAAAAFVVTSAAMPRQRRGPEVRIDLRGMALLATATTALVLLVSLGGVTVPWASWPAAALGVGGVASVVALLAVERRALDPVMPLRLFSIRSFALASGIAFVVNVALHGSLTYLPIYFQVVDGRDPTMSGLALAPMMVGLLVVSVCTGFAISRTGRYKVFPVAGGAAMTVGLLLLSRLPTVGSPLQSTLSLLVLGVGVGLVTPVLVIVVQDAVGFRDLGVATAGVTYFRAVGASIGVAAFGAILNRRLAQNLAELGAGLRITTGATSPGAIAELPPDLQDAVVKAYASSIRTLFLVAVPIAAAAFVLALRLPERPLKKTSKAANPVHTLAPLAYPFTAGSLDELGRALGVLMSREARHSLLRTVARDAGLDLTPDQTSAMLRLVHPGGITLDDLATRFGWPIEDVGDLAASLAAKGLAQTEQGGLVATAMGKDLVDRLVEARRAGLARMLEGWAPEDHPEVVDLVRRLAVELVEDGSPRKGTVAGS